MNEYIELNDRMEQLSVKVGSKITKKKLESDNYTFTGNIEFSNIPKINSVNVATITDISSSSDIQESLSNTSFNNFAYNWNNSSLHNEQLTFEWTCITESSDGKIKYSGNSNGFIYKSNDFGSTWTSSLSGITKTVTGIASSLTGQYIIACASNVGEFQNDNTGQDLLYSSNDYGENWGSFTGSNIWLSIEISKDGKYGTATTFNDGIYITDNYGVTWIKSTAIIDKNWKAVFLSDSGKLQTACSFRDGIYTSNDYGVTWNKSNVPSDNFIKVSGSGNGKFLTVCSDLGKIYISNDYGTIWNEAYNDPSITFTDVKVSSTGQYILVSCTDSTNNLYYSSNYGNRFDINTLVNYNILCLSISSSGQFYSSCGSGFISTGDANNSLSLPLKKALSIMPILQLDDPTIGSFYFDSYDSTINVYNGNRWIKFTASN